MPYRTVAKIAGSHSRLERRLLRRLRYKGRFENGSYVILGNREDVQQVHTRTPVLGSIPVVERLFRGNYEQRIFRLVAAQVLVKGFDAKGGL